MKMPLNKVLALRKFWAVYFYEEGYKKGASAYCTKALINCVVDCS